MSLIPINIIPLKQPQKMVNPEKSEPQIIFAEERDRLLDKQLHIQMSDFDFSDDQELFKTYLHSLRLLKVTNVMLRAEIKLLVQELHEYKKKEIDAQNQQELISET
ncbi:MAG: hypothetical protein KBD31_04105 [Proteobacteria bacterium]|nr:hypothetical protein [Pseudomonadota bacterium]